MRANWVIAGSISLTLCTPSEVTFIPKAIDTRSLRFAGTQHGPMFLDAERLLRVPQRAPFPYRGKPVSCRQRDDQRTMNRYGGTRCHHQAAICRAGEGGDRALDLAGVCTLIGVTSSPSDDAVARMAPN